MTKIWRVKYAKSWDQRYTEYKYKNHAVAAYNQFKHKGFEVSLLEAEVSDWVDISPTE